MGTLVIFPIAAALAVLGKRRFEETVFPAIGVVILTLTVTGMMGAISVGIYFLPIFLIASVVLLIVRRTDFNKYVLTPGLWAFTLIILFFIIFSFGRFFTSDVALSQYGTVILNMYDTDSLKDTCIYHDLNWPLPFVSVWAFFCSYTSGGFSEWLCIFAYDIFIVSAVLPLFGYVKLVKARKWQWFVVLLFCMLLPILKQPDVYSSYDMAFPQAVSMVYVFLMINHIVYVKHSDVSKWWYASFAAYGILMSCTLTKYGIYASIPLLMGVWAMLVSVKEVRRFLLFGIGSGCILATIFGIYGKLSAGNGRYGVLIIPTCCLICAFLAIVLTMIVRLYEKGYRIAAEGGGLLLAAGIVAMAVVLLLNSPNREFLKEWFIEYTDKIMLGLNEEDFILGKRVIPIYDATFLFIMMIVCGFASGRIEKAFPDKAVSLRAVNLSFVFGTVAYLIVLGVIYINVLRIPLAASEPLIASYVAPVIILSVAVVFVQSFVAWRKDIVLVIGTVSLLACVFSDPVSAILDKPEYEDRYPIISACGDMGLVELTGSDRVFYIDRELTMIEATPKSFIWAVFPAGADSINGLFFNPEPYKWSSDIERSLSPEELAALIKEGNYTYVYLKCVDDYFWETYYPDFANYGADIRNDALYRVEYDESGQLQISYIAGLAQDENAEEEE